MGKAVSFFLTRLFVGMLVATAGFAWIVRNQNQATGCRARTHFVRFTFVWNLLFTSIPSTVIGNSETDCARPTPLTPNGWLSLAEPAQAAR
jgi:hypothetical protein